MPNELLRASMPELAPVAVRRVDGVRLARRSGGVGAGVAGWQTEEPGYGSPRASLHGRTPPASAWLAGGWRLIVVSPRPLAQGAGRAGHADGPRRHSGPKQGASEPGKSAASARTLLVVRIRFRLVVQPLSPSDVQSSGRVQWRRWCRPESSRLRVAASLKPYGVQQFDCSESST